MPAKKGAIKDVAPKAVPIPGDAKLSHGSVTVIIPGYLTPPEAAGKMSPDEVKRTPKVPHGIGLICSQTADGIEKAGDKFVVPGKITATTLRASGTKAEDIDNIILDVEVILQTLKQANLLFDADAWDKLREINDQVKTQAKRNPELLVIFKPLIDFLAKGPRVVKPTPPAK